jgi:hypothetical protein
MTQRAILATLIVALAAACSESAPEGAAATTRARADSAIYAILLDSLRGSGDSVLVAREFDQVADSTTEVPALAAWVHERSPALDSALVVAVAQARFGGSVQATLGQLRGVRWFRDLREIGEPSSYPRYRFLSFSRVVYDPSGTHAVVYAFMGCGGLCGNGSYYAFELRDGMWRKVGQVVRIIS